MAYGKCFLSGRCGIVERHHIFGGALRKKSERLGLVVDLSPWMHREGPKAAHRCWDTRQTLCKYGQRKAMIEQGWTVDEFIREFGRNWLTDAELDEVDRLRIEDLRNVGACAGWNSLLDEILDEPRPGWDDCGNQSEDDDWSLDPQEEPGEARMPKITVTITIGEEEMPF